MAHNFHGPGNAEHELRKAYNAAADANVIFTWVRRPIDGVRFEDVEAIYRHALRSHEKSERLAAERWARTAKHLSRALMAEAKISFLECWTTALPFIGNADAEEFNLHESPENTRDLLDSLAASVPAGLDAMPVDMRRYLDRAREHLVYLNQPDYTHELLRAERVKAAYEYGRVLECMSLALEAENASGDSSAA